MPPMSILTSAIGLKTKLIARFHAPCFKPSSSNSAASRGIIRGSGDKVSPLRSLSANAPIRAMSDSFHSPLKIPSTAGCKAMRPTPTGIPCAAANCVPRAVMLVPVFASRVFAASCRILNLPNSLFFNPPVELK